MINKKDFMLCGKISQEDYKDTYFNACWKANIKFDGERIIAIKKDGEVFLVNRRGNIKNSHYAEVVESLNAFDDDFIIDGEVITFDDNFNKLQRRSLTKNPIKQKQLRNEIPVTYMIFDILNYNGEDLRNNVLDYRCLMLQNLIHTKYNFLGNDKSIGIAEYQDIDKCLKFSEENNREGIIIKNMNSVYETKRSNNWLKLKFFKNTDLKLISYTTNTAGIRCEDKIQNAVQISGEQHKEVKNQIDNIGYCDVTIQYLEQGKTGRYRFPSFVKLTELNKQQARVKENTLRNSQISF